MTLAVGLGLRRIIPATVWARCSGLLALLAVIWGAAATWAAVRLHRGGA